MSRRGTIYVECESEDCHAEEVFCPDDLDGIDISQRLLESNWTIVNGRDTCPQCVEEVEKGTRCNGCLCLKDGDPCYCPAPEGRERGDDDGQEYGHPGDQLAGWE